MAGSRTPLFFRKIPGGVHSIVNESVISGNIFFVDSGHSSALDNTARGASPDNPFATIDYAIGQCSESNGDHIFVLPGHTETVTAAITLDKIGITIKGMGQGTARPQITCATDSIDEMTITAANCIVENLLFNESTGTTSRASFINIAAANTTIRGCEFNCGQYDLEQITITTAGDDAIIEDCKFVVTANGPDAGIEIEAAGTARTLIRGNYFVCSDGTNSFDAAAINSTVANTGMIVTENSFIGAGVASTAVIAASAIDKNIFSNNYGSGVASVDEDIFSGDVHVTADPPPLVVDDKVWYVDSVDGNVAFDGHTPKTALITLAAAEALAAHGDTIILASGHTETLTTAVSVDKKINIIGSGTGLRRPTFTINANIDGIDVTVDSVLITNLYFNEGTAAHTASINVGGAHCTIDTCHFDCGTNDLESITVATAGDYLTVKDCTFEITANGPDAAIELEGTSDRTTVTGCTFNGGSVTNAWDAAAVNSTTAVTNVEVYGNTFIHQAAATLPASSNATTTPFSMEDNVVRSIGTATTPQDLYVDSATGTDVAGGGYGPQSPVATIDYAISLAIDNNGDTIHVLPGHAETVTGAITVDKIGLTIKSLGKGTDRATISCATDSIDEMTITAANCTIDGLYFNESTGTTSRTSFINVAAAFTTLRNCHFDCGQYDLEQITVTSAGNDLLVENCEFLVTADGPDAGIELEDTSARTTVRGCTFNGGSATNAWDAAAINSTAATTEVSIEDNVFIHQKVSTKPWTLSATTTPPVVQNNVFTGIATAQTPLDLYVDNATGTDVAGYGYHIDSPVATIDYAISLAITNNGDTIHILPGHAETVTGAITVDKAGLTIKSMGKGTNRAAISCATNSIDEMTITQPNCTIDGLYFNESTGSTQRTSFINVGAAFTTIRNCHFDCGQYDLEQITVEAAGNDLAVEDCVFLVTADGPDAGIELEDTSARTTIRGCMFNGGSATNAWDAGAVNSTAAVTEVVLEDNTFLHQKSTIEPWILSAMTMLPVIRGNIIKGIATAQTPQDLYVDSGTGTDVAGYGYDIEMPVATIDYAIGLAITNNGDTIHILPGHTETVTGAITVDKAGLTIKSMGQGTTRAVIDCATASIDEMTITQPNCIVDGLYFNESTNATQRASFINVGAAFTTIRNCQFDCGQYDLEQITVETAGADLLVEDCVFLVTADGPDAGIEFEGTSARLAVRGCMFNGGSATNAWDAGAVNSTSAVTEVVLENNTFLHQKSTIEPWILSAMTMLPVIRGNIIKGIATAQTPQDLYVDSGTGTDVAGYGYDIETPAATIDYAIGLAVTSNGDTIHVLPGHAETIAAAGIVVDAIGLSIKGMGVGDNRPTITLSATDSDVDIDADDVYISNLRFISSIDDLVLMIDANAENLTMEDCEFITGTATECGNFINIATTKDRFTFRHCRFIQPTDPNFTDGNAATGCFYFEDTEEILVEDCYFSGWFETSIFHNKTTLTKRLWINRCWGTQELSGADIITLVDNSTGGMARCNFTHTVAADVVEGTFMTLAATTPFGFFDTYFMNDNGGGGKLALAITAVTT